MNIGNTGNSDDGTDACFLNFHFVQTVKLIELADFRLATLFRVVGIDDDSIFIHTDRTVADLADTDTANIFIIINGTDQYLCALVRITFRSRNVVDDRLK